MNEKFVVKGARPDLLPDRFVRNVMEVALQFMPGRRFFRMDILRFITLTRVARLEFRRSGKSALTLVDLVKSRKNNKFRRLRKKLRRQGAQILRNEAYFSVRRNKPAGGEGRGRMRRNAATGLFTSPSPLTCHMPVLILRPL